MSPKLRVCSILDLHHFSSVLAQRAEMVDIGGHFENPGQDAGK